MRAAIAATTLFLLLPTSASAERHTRPGPVDSRVRSVTYNERDVIRLIGHYRYQTVVEFARDEYIHGVYVGDPQGWEVSYNAERNTALIKPVELDADTNLTIVTSRPGLCPPENSLKRVYNFSLHAEKSMSHHDKSMTWFVRFHYPSDQQEQRRCAQIDIDHINSTEIRPGGYTPPWQWNMSYTYAGDKSLVPTRVFDDGIFTYFYFSGHTDPPAIFLVDEAGNEALVNHKQKGPYTVVQRIGRRFSLRNGDKATCIFNDAFKRGRPDLDINSPRDRDNPGPSALEHHEGGFIRRSFSRAASATGRGVVAAWSIATKPFVWATGLVTTKN